MMANGLCKLLWLIAAAAVHVSGAPLHHFYDDDLEKLTNSVDDYFVVFTTPWCGQRCRHIEHLFQDLADAIEEDEDLNMSVGIIDGSAEKELVSAFEIEDFPTLKYRCGGKTYHFPHVTGKEYQDTSRFLKFVRKEYFAHAKDHLKALREMKKAGLNHRSLMETHPNFEHMRKLRETLQASENKFEYTPEIARQALKDGGHWDLLMEAAEQQNDMIAKRMAQKRGATGEATGEAGVSV